MKNLKEIEVMAIEDVKSIRRIAGKGINVIVNAPSYKYDVEFYNEEVYLLENGKELEVEGTMIETDDDVKVYDWLNDLKKEFELV